MSIPYLLCSLPDLELGGVAPFSVEECRRSCDVYGVNISDFDAVIAGVPGSHPFTVAYANALIQIKNATAAFRASKWEGENIKFSERLYSGYHADLQQKTSRCHEHPKSPLKGK